MGETWRGVHGSEMLVAPVDSGGIGVSGPTFYTCMDELVVVDTEALDRFGNMLPYILSTCHGGSVSAVRDWP